MSWAKRRFQRLLQIKSFKGFCEQVCAQAADYTRCSIAIWGPDGAQFTKRWMYHDICKSLYGDAGQPGPGRSYCDEYDAKSAATVMQEGTFESYRCWAGFWSMMIPIRVDTEVIGLISVGEYFREGDDDSRLTAMVDNVVGIENTRLRETAHDVTTLSPAQEAGVQLAVTNLARTLGDIVCYRINLETMQEYFSRAARDIGTLLKGDHGESDASERLAAALGSLTLVSLVNLYLGDVAEYMGQLRRDTEHNALSPLTRICAVAEKLESLDLGEARTLLIDTTEEIKRRVRTRYSSTDLDDGNWWLLTPRRFDLSLIKRRIQDRLIVSAAEAEVLLDFQGWSGEIHHDLSLLTILVEVLVDNAIKASRYPAGATTRPRILIHCRKEKAALSIRVQDHGCGIPEEARLRIFDKGWCASHQQYRAGTGLGLHQLQRNIDFLGAEVHLKSDVGHGSCFTITIPRLDHLSHTHLQSKQGQ